MIGAGLGIGVGRGKRRSGRECAAGLLVGFALVLGGGPAEAEGEAAEPVLSIPGGAGGAQSGDPGLDALLQLPDRYRDLGTGARSVAGASEDEWRRRFGRAKTELLESRAGLEQTKRELDSMAEGGGASQWSVAPPGGSGSGGPSTSPLSFKLRQELKRNRERLEEADRRLRELEIQADLAGVPPDWRGEPVPPAPRPISEAKRR